MTNGGRQSFEQMRNELKHWGRNFWDCLVDLFLLASRAESEVVVNLMTDHFQ